MADQTITTKGGWSQALLVALGAPVTTTNMAFISAWIDREGTRARWNPLATTQGGYGETGTINSIGVREYDTAEHGIQATVHTLRNGHYPTILASIMAGNPTASLGAATEWQTYSGGTDYGNQIWSLAQNYISDNAQFGQGYRAAGTDTGNAITGTIPDNSAPPDATDPQYAAAQDEKFGAFSWLMDNPEVGPLLRDASKNGWGWNEFFAKLQETTWWQSHSAAQRKWDALYSTDPAEASRQLNERITDITGLSSRLGAGISDERLKLIAFQSLRLGWRQEDLQRAVLAETRYNPKAAGQIGDTETKVKNLAAQYGVGSPDKRANQFARDILAGKTTIEGVEQHFRQVAKAMFPAFADEIDKGITLRDIADPYIQAASHLLEVDANQIDLTDPKYARPLTNRNDKGKPQPMSLDEWASTLMEDARYGWGKTANARDAAFQLTRQLGAAMGRYA